VLVALGSAFLSEQAGLSLALGAFLAGLILAESDLRSQVIADILPFRDTFSSVFFISVGMMLLPRDVAAAPLLVLVATVGMVLWKLVAASLGARISGYPWRTAFAAGLAVAHVGEFSFVLAQQGRPAGLLPAPYDQAFFAGAVFSMMITPWLVSRAPAWAQLIDGLERLVPLDRLLPGFRPRSIAAAEQSFSDHVIIAGYGLNGQNLARVLRATHIAHVVLDMAPEAIAQCALEGSPALIGNATQDEILRHAEISRARVLVLALSDPFATRHASRMARQFAPDVFILARTRSVKEIDELYAAGANLVIPEEFETSIEIFTSVLRGTTYRQHHRGADRRAPPGALLDPARPQAAEGGDRAARRRPHPGHDRGGRAAPSLARDRAHARRDRAARAGDARPGGRVDPLLAATEGFGGRRAPARRRHAGRDRQPRRHRQGDGRAGAADARSLRGMRR
jgi:CPA2 family monovalent cation:H+ antiporter-2